MDLLNDDVKRINLCFWSFIDIYAFCETGQTVTDRFNDFEMELQQCKWYSFELKLQRNFFLFASIAEKPTTTYGYGHIECVRSSLKKVKFRINVECAKITKKKILFYFYPMQTISSSFSYFMALRQLD